MLSGLKIALMVFVSRLFSSPLSAELLLQPCGIKLAATTVASCCFRKHLLKIRHCVQTNKQKNAQIWIDSDLISLRGLICVLNSETLAENPNLLRYRSQHWTYVIVSSGFSSLLCFLSANSPTAMHTTKVLKTQFTRKKTKKVLRLISSSGHSASVPPSYSLSLYILFLAICFGEFLRDDAMN